MLPDGALTERVIGSAIEVHRRLGGYAIGLLLNFNALRLKDGLRRFVI